MRKLAYPVAALAALVVSSSALADSDPTMRDAYVHELVGGGGNAPAGVDENENGGADSLDDDSEDDDALDYDRSATMGESEGGGCSQSGVPPAGRNAALVLLGLAFMSFGIRLPPRRRRARSLPVGRAPLSD